MHVSFLPFLVTMLTINLMPGAAMLYCINSALSHGRYLGIIAAIGVELGTFFYVLLTAAGLATLIASSPLLYSIIQITGSLYLLYLAWTSWPKHSQKIVVNTHMKKTTAWHKLAGGFAVNAMNPKILMFFLMLLPQFVSAEYHNQFIFFVLGIIFNISGLIVDILVVLFSLQIKKWFTKENAVISLLKFVPSFIFVLVACLGISHAYHYFF